MLKDMTPRRTAAFARALRRAIVSLENQTTGCRRWPRRGAGHDGLYDRQRSKWVYKRYSTLAETIAAIHIAASWFDKVASLGFGVYADNRTIIQAKL